MTNNKCRPTNQTETLKYIDDTADQLDEQRLAGLQEEQNTQLIKDEVLQREKNRLEVKHGKDHPEVLEAESRVMYNRQMSTGLDREIEKASIKTEPLPGNGWRVHGRVFDQNIKPVKGVTVYFSDQGKRWVEVLGNSCTNEVGYYSLTANEKVLDQIGKEQILYLTVSDKNKTVIYTSTETLVPVKGMIIYRDIYLKQEDCVPPPPNKREIITG
jgi:hypothetical protein